jgi:ADP-ribose pyrophosphatase YjhB (NUDIX family)
MEIKSKISCPPGPSVDVIYNDINSEKELGDKKIKHVHAYCFCNNKLVIVYSDKGWTPPGGGVEKNEDLRSAITREVKEESNMKVIRQRFIGCQDIFENNSVISQTRSICIVEPYGPFTSDPGGDITEIKLIDPKDYKKYFDWKEIGDHIMNRALEIKKQMDSGLNYFE